MTLADGREMALKRLAPTMRARDQLSQRLIAEGMLQRRLEGCEGVVQCYSVIEELPALFLERVPGGSLAEINAFVSLPIDAALRVFRRVSGAVACAHGRDVVHRDIKPSNILFGIDGTPHLADFGVAVRRGARSTADGWDDIDVGTLGYAAPELLRDPATANTDTVDIYGLGALLHELLLGATPHMMHGAESEPELRSRIVGGATRDLTPRESELSESHRRALDAALAPHSQQRPQSVLELLALLDGA